MNPLPASAFVRDRVASGFRRIVSGDPSGAPEWVEQLKYGTDAGYFGPGSAAWAVHGGLPTLVGGIRALLMQALHPAALTGVMQHSRYEEDALGRLAGTTQWLTVVTFGDKAQADRECARVRGMHRRVNGVFEVDGVSHPYDATDPELLRWVHIAFTDSFLAAHEVWGGPIPGGPDAYVREWAKAGELVGVVDPPRSVAELRNQLAAFESDLRGSAEARATAAFVRKPPLPFAAQGPYAVLLLGALSTMSPRHLAMLGLPRSPSFVAQPAVRAMLGGLALALGPTSPSQQAATARVAGETSLWD
ncbi:MAG: oxygenase MpaB family protein [Candidatus Nanopelagicales bacterium]|nr:oxygenase MpaB family protein [Candidatus Nanopelagicales bacterium]